MAMGLWFEFYGFQIVANLLVCSRSTHFSLFVDTLLSGLGKSACKDGEDGEDGKDGRDGKSSCALLILLSIMVDYN